MAKLQTNTKNKKNDKNDRSDRIEFEGEVLEALPGALFKIKMAAGAAEIICVLSGRVRQNKIRILPGDRVTVEVSPYDLTRGRIMWRKSNNDRQTHVESEE